MRLPRPHVPIRIRLLVAQRQLGVAPAAVALFDEAFPSPRYRLALMLRLLQAKLDTDRKLELHHRPALVNRRRRRNGEYDPPANDPEHLFYVPEDDHDVETRVRGLGAQRSDLSQRRYLKRVARNRERRKMQRRRRT